MYRTRIISIILCACMLAALFPAASAEGAPDFSDVPSGHWAADCISRLRELGITDGVGGNRFGLGQTISRAEFATFMCKVMGWTQLKPETGSFEDNKNPSSWYYGYLEAAAAGGAVTAGGAFRPLEPITREEMAVMLVRALGYDSLAVQMDYLKSPFEDVSSSQSYIAMAYDLGIISGMTPKAFAPGNTALREHAASMLIKMVEILDNEPEYLNAFYAVSSASQMGAIDGFDCVSFGWSRLVLENGDTLRLDSARSGNNEYGVPAGYDEPYGAAGGKTRLLMVAVSAEDAPLIISCPELQARAAELMAEAAKGISGPDGDALVFDGIVADFEGLNGEALREQYVLFLETLREKLGAGKLMTVAVQPQRREGQFSYSGYDYRAIGELADKVILMAHDYNAKRLTADEMARGIVMTPLAPIEEIYYALRAITDKATGVADISKIALQFSFATAQWKTRNGAVINDRPYTPAFTAVRARIDSGAEIKYSAKHESPYITFDDPEDDTGNVVWYEDSRSIAAKTRLALLFGVTGFSYWRLGEIPDGSAEQYLNVLDGIGK